MRKSDLSNHKPPRHLSSRSSPPLTDTTRSEAYPDLAWLPRNCPSQTLSRSKPSKASPSHSDTIAYGEPSRKASTPSHRAQFPPSHPPDQFRTERSEQSYRKFSHGIRTGT